MRTVRLLTLGMLSVVLLASVARAAGIPAGESLWLKADAGAGLSGGVFTWADQSGNGNNVGNDTAASQPTLVNDAINGQPAVRFDGVDDYLASQSVNFLGNTQGSVFAVYRFTADFSTNKSNNVINASKRGVAFPNNPEFHAFSFEQGYNSGNVVLGPGDGTYGGLRTASGAIITSDAGIYTLVGNGATTSMYFNGANLPLTNYVGFDPTGKWFADASGADTFTLGAVVRDAKQNFAQVDLAEVIIYSTALSTADRNQVLTYLGDKYGISGPDIPSISEPPENRPKARQRRILINNDGDACLVWKKGGHGPTQITADDVKANVDEISYPGSQVDTMLLNISAQVMFYPSKVGTMRGTLDPPEKRKNWEFASEPIRFRNVEAMFAQGVDPYAVMLAEAKKRGLEALLSYRMNDAHGCSFLHCKFWLDHPEYRLGEAFDFRHEAVRDYTFRLIEEAVHRYDCDGIELDFNRFPNFFQSGTEAERIATINGLVYRVRQMLNRQGKKLGKRLVLAARVPTSYQQCRQIGLDPVVWSKNGWIDFLTVSEFLFVRYDLPVKPWKEMIKEVPIYAGIEAIDGDASKLEGYMIAEKYRRAAQHLWNDGADGIYLFNWLNFSLPQWDGKQFEPPLEVLKELGDLKTLQVH